MTLQRQKAAAPTAAPRTKFTSKEYHHSGNQSSEKTREQLGGILLALHTPLSPKQQSVLWGTFEFKLRQYVGLKVCGVTL